MRTQAEALAAYEILMNLWPNKQSNTNSKSIYVNRWMLDPEFEVNMTRSVKTWLAFNNPEFAPTMFRFIDEEMWKGWLDLTFEQREAFEIASAFLYKWKHDAKEWWPKQLNNELSLRYLCRAIITDSFFFNNHELAFRRILEWKRPREHAQMTIPWFCDRQKRVIERILENTYHDSDQRETYAYPILTTRRDKTDAISGEQRAKNATALSKLGRELDEC